MKTIQEASKMSPNGVDIQSETGKIVDQYGNTEMGRYRMQIFVDKLSEISFKNGVEFAESWINIEDEKPEYYLPIIIYTEDGCVIAWRAWSETHGDVYTISGTNIVLKEAPKRWRPLNRK